MINGVVVRWGRESVRGSSSGNRLVKIKAIKIITVILDIISDMGHVKNARNVVSFYR